MAKKEGQNGKQEVPFVKVNYLLLAGAVITVIVGFLLMAGGSSNSPDVFNEAIFSFRRITLAPIVVLSGYVLGFYAIMKKSNTAR